MKCFCFCDKRIEMELVQRERLHICWWGKRGWLLHASRFWVTAACLLPLASLKISAGMNWKILTPLQTLWLPDGVSELWSYHKIWGPDQDLNFESWSWFWCLTPVLLQLWNNLLQVIFLFAPTKLWRVFKRRFCKYSCRYHLGMMEGRCLCTENCPRKMILVRHQWF